MQKALTVGLLFCLSLFPALGQNLREYVQFAEPAKRYLKVAEEGDSRGLAQVAQRYLSGEGIPQDYEEFAERISIAAEHGDQWAQLMLGLAYIAGRGVPASLVTAHMWSNVAGAGSDEKIALLARQQRDMISGSMSQDQIAKAQELARAWKPKQELARNGKTEGSQGLEKDASAGKHTRWAFWRR